MQLSQPERELLLILVHMVFIISGEITMDLKMDVGRIDVVIM